MIDQLSAKVKWILDHVEEALRERAHVVVLFGTVDTWYLNDDRVHVTVTPTPPLPCCSTSTGLLRKLFSEVRSTWLPKRHAHILPGSQRTGQLMREKGMAFCGEKRGLLICCWQ